ncbi:hypothetical protein AU196_22390 [Mycobacterium sp. IS-1742]|uniref:DUF4190 domain-containing protein n=1 Tax=Mycobacterium sp. IS-1742 TaxID=1772285 RepID=UPI00073FBD49|nr:DUF4190 domain-containing protein [Mycobacterium sp. IS-1742]KUI25569.1 hypothetical protein AU196_22390 [Mycobacterium sp. IS-1742]
MADSTLPPGRFGAGYVSGGAARAQHAGFTAPALPPDPPLNRLAVATFVTALVFGLAAALITLPLSYVAHRQIETSGQGGAGLARAAMVISGLYLVIGLVVVGLYLYLPPALDGSG